MAKFAEIDCPYCRTRHGNLDRPHAYEPDQRQPVDPIAGMRPCCWCGRFAGSYLHQEADHG